MASFFAAVDTAVMGRKTYEAALAMGGGSLEPSSMATYVVSRSQPSGKRESVTFTNQSPDVFIRGLREYPGKNIWLMGGGELARDFLKADLVGEIHLGVVPSLLGEGIPLFPGGFPQRDFSLIENKSHSQSMFAVKYKRARSKTQSKN